MTIHGRYRMEIDSWKGGGGVIHGGERVIHEPHLWNQWINRRHVTKQLCLATAQCGLRNHTPLVLHIEYIRNARAGYIFGNSLL